MRYIRKLLWLFFEHHDWKYLSLTERVCLTCDRHERAYFANTGEYDLWWEVISLGIEERHYEQVTELSRKTG